MHLILTGATGLVGSAVLDAMIKMTDVSKITILTRRPVKMAEEAHDPRINIVTHKDFGIYDKETLDQLRGANGCVWALGISQTKVGKEEYVKITKDYALAAAKAFQDLPGDGSNAPFRFVYVSGQGATLQPGLFTPIFGRVKGETERDLADMRKANPTFLASSIRPAAVDMGSHDALQSSHSTRPLYERALLTGLRPLLTTFLKNSWSPTQQLGNFLARAAMGTWDQSFEEGGPGIEKLGDFPIVENSVMWRLLNAKV